MPSKYKLALYYQQLVNRVQQLETLAGLAFGVSVGEFKILVKASMAGVRGTSAR